MKNKLFFFGAYEGFKQASSIVVGQTVPSILGGGGLRSGNVTYQTCGVGNSINCTSPTLLTLTPADIATLDQRSQDPTCATTICPAPETNAAAVAYFNEFPVSNSNGAGDLLNTGGYTFTSPAPIHQITNIARIDWNVTPRQTLFVRGNLQSDNQATSLQFPGLPAASNVFGNNKGIAAGHTWSINDRMTNNFRYGLVRLGTPRAERVASLSSTLAPSTTLTAATTSTVYHVTTNNFADDSPS